MNINKLSLVNVIRNPVDTSVSMILMSLGVAIISMMLLISNATKNQLESNLGGVPKFCTNRGSSCHSEMQVLKCIECEDKRKVRKYVMWNIRWTKSGNIANSKPCINCQKALIDFGIQTIVYSTEDGNFIKCRLDELNCKPSSGFLNYSKY